MEGAQARLERRTKLKGSRHEELETESGKGVSQEATYLSDGSPWHTTLKQPVKFTQRCGETQILPLEPQLLSLRDR